jgi:CRP-like cAMP-binding protein
MAEGDPGDDYYVVVSGAVDVSIGGVTVNRLGPGDGFGELALVHDIPRTATVTATLDCQFLTIDRRSFLVATSGGTAAALVDYG